MQLLQVLCLLLVICNAIAFSVAPRSVSLKPSSLGSRVSFLQAKPKAEPVPNGYWEGEWICADCGYIYDRDIDGGGLYFEELKKGFICPQCSAPRKR
jgi:rubredoxin